MHEKGTSGVDRKNAGLRILQGGWSPWDPGPNICLQPHKEVFSHSLESLLSALRDGKAHWVCFLFQTHSVCWVLGTSPQAGSEGTSRGGISQ